LLGSLPDTSKLTLFDQRRKNIHNDATTKQRGNIRYIIGGHDDADE